jgi:protocatechuate 3,4-dioxygenase beta subunit
MKRNWTRREALTLLGVGGVTTVVGCASSPTAASSSAAATSTTTAGGALSAACAVTPEETAGPYPDMTGMVNNAAFFRQDVTEGRTGTALQLTLTVVNVNSSCAPVSGLAVEIWQCDASGNYSEYAQPGYNGTGQTFLRGLQTTNSSGTVTFRTIYPGWYQGRATHIHVQVFRSGAVLKTTQIAFPESTSAAVYQTGSYAAHGQNPMSNSTDMVFADGTQYELLSLSGDASSGFVGTLTIGVSV